MATGQSNTGVKWAESRGLCRESGFTWPWAPRPHHIVVITYEIANLAFRLKSGADAY